MMLLLLFLNCWNYRHALSHLPGIMHFVSLVLQNSRLNYFCLGCCYNKETMWLTEQVFSPYFSDWEVLKWGYLLGCSVLCCWVGKRNRLLQDGILRLRWQQESLASDELNWTEPNLKRMYKGLFIDCYTKLGFFVQYFLIPRSVV